MNIREELGVLLSLCTLVNDAQEVRVTSIMVHAPAMPRDADISVTLQFVATVPQLHGALAVTTYRDVTITSRSINKIVIAFPGLAFGATLENIGGEACNTLSGAVAECDPGKSHTVCMAILTAALKTMRTMDLANGFSRQSPAIVNEVMLRIGDMLTAFPATSPRGGQVDKHIVAESVHRLYDAVKNTRDARLSDFSTSVSGSREVGYVHASFMEPGNPNGKHTLTFVLDKNYYELRFDDAALLSAAIQPLQRTPVHVFGAATVDCRQKGVLICLAALSVIHDLLAKPSTHSVQAALLCTHAGFALRALRDEHTRTMIPTEVAREVAKPQPTGLNELAAASEYARKVEDTLYGREPAGFKKDTFYDIAGITSGRESTGKTMGALVGQSRIPEYGTSLMEDLNRRTIEGMGIPKGLMDDAQHAISYALTMHKHALRNQVHDEVELLVPKTRPALPDPRYAPTVTADFEVRGDKIKCTAMRTNLTPADSCGNKPRHSDQLRKRGNVEAVIKGSTFDWFRVNMGPNSETRIAQLVEIAELTLTFEFRDSLDGKRTTSKIHFSGFAQMRENLQRIVGDPFRTDNSVFTKRLGVDLPYDID